MRQKRSKRHVVAKFKCANSTSMDFDFDGIKSGKYSNIKYFNTFLPDEELYQLQRNCMIHLCPSSSEGFGHYLNEAKVLGSVLVTSNHPPMNELITPESGYLIPILNTSHMGSIGAQRCTLDPNEIYTTIQQVFSASVADNAAKCIKAIEQFEGDLATFNNQMNLLSDAVKNNTVSSL